jgi:DNA-binding IclR family transcriptional regulator
MAGNSRSHPGRSVTSKVAAVLDAFLPSTRELSLTELASRTGLPTTTTYRLVSDLVEWGGVERGANGGYRIGIRMWEIGSLAITSSKLRDIVVPYMQDLYESTHENVQLAVLDGTDALYVEKISGRKSSPIRTRRGGRLPLHATGVGKVLLAYAPGDLVQALLQHNLRRYTPYTIVEPAALLRALAEIRRVGVGYAREELTVGSVSVAAPLFDSAGQAVAAMSLVARSSRVDLRRLAPAVRTAAISASRELRCRSVSVADTAAAVVRAGTSA